MVILRTCELMVTMTKVPPTSWSCTTATSSAVICLRKVVSWLIVELFLKSASKSCVIWSYLIPPMLSVVEVKVFNVALTLTTLGKPYGQYAPVTTMIPFPTCQGPSRWGGRWCGSQAQREHRRPSQSRNTFVGISELRRMTNYFYVLSIWIRIY